MVRLARKKSFAILGLALLLFTQKQDTIIQSEFQPDNEQILIYLTNLDRIDNGVQPLEFDAELLSIARQRAAESLSLPALSHYDENGNLIFAQLLQAANVDYTLAGENIARSGSETQLDAIESAWMNSVTHRKNILDPGFGRLAIGEATTNDQVVYVEIFRNA